MTPTPPGQVPEALRLAEALERPGYGWHTTPAQCAAELRRLHAENTALQQGYDAARMEIEVLRDRVQELGAMLRENRSKRIVALEAENLGLLHALAAEQDANADLRQQLESIGAGGVEPLRKADHFRDATEMISHAWGCRANAFGKCDKGCTEEHERLAKDALDAARYRYLRDGDWRSNEKLASVTRLQLNMLWDAKIDAARSQAKKGANHD